MNPFQHYHAFANELMVQNPEAYETLDEEINIIIHKLKFIPKESRPKVKIIQSGSSPIDPDYLSELIDLAGAQEQIFDLQDNSEDILIFIHEHPSFISEIPNLLTNQEKPSKAIGWNKIYLIQKTAFANNIEDYLEDTEILAEIIQSKYFHYGHEGTHWIKFDVQ